MKKRIAIISLILACILAFCSCGGNEEPVPSSDSGSSASQSDSGHSGSGQSGSSSQSGSYEWESESDEPEEPIEPDNPTSWTDIYDGAQVYSGGIHNFSATQTSNFLIKANGTTDYSIILPSGAGNEIVTTAEDMQSLIFESSGVRMDIVTESSLATAKFISVGKTTKATQASVTPSSDLGNEGYIIKTVGDNVYITANTDFGVSFGVYGFLEAQFGFECMTDDYYYIDTVSSLPLLNLNVKEVPDFATREIGSGYVNGKAIRRMKLLDRGEYTAGYRTVHTSDRYIPASLYNDYDVYTNNADVKAEIDAAYPSASESQKKTIARNKYYHQKWFGSGCNQLCYLAHGDSAERTALVNKVAEIIEDYFINDLTKTYMCFGQVDEYTWCTCSYCTNSYNTYKSNAAVVIQFLNDVTAKVDAWMNGTGSQYKRDYVISFLAYQKTLDAPKLVDNSVRCGEHVAAMFCPYNMDLQNSLYADVNKTFLQTFEDWKAVSPKFCYFGYFYTPNNFLVYHDSFEAMKDVMVYLATCNMRVFYTETPPEYRASGWHTLRIYVLSKLAWNVNLDIDDLITNFCNKYFGGASDIMHEIFNQERALYSTNRAALTSASFYSTDIAKSEYWPKNLVLNWYNMTNDAIDEISYLKKTDPELYDEIYHNITIERLSFEYMLIQFYDKELDVDFVNTLKAQAKQDAEENGVLMFSLTDSITSLFNGWGV